MNNQVRRFWLLVLLVLVLVISSGAWGQVVWYVDDDGVGDLGAGDPLVSDPLEDGSLAHPFDAIQEGIDMALGGDVVMVLDGIYTGLGNRDIDFWGKAITVRSENGAGSCIIDCQGAEADPHRGFYFHNLEGFNSVLEGFSIKNGYSTIGGGIYCDKSSPLIRECVIESCQANHGGGVGGTSQANFTLSNCRITQCVSTSAGGAIALDDRCQIKLQDCVLEKNQVSGAGGGIFLRQSGVTLERSTISH
ncbi:MAG: hypothetical protein GY869_21940, partial [Planctomycetes bacterium]|nr:hypothetical protein [Planctomycetota bacterium]